jgi:hypothetical protein
VGGRGPVTRAHCDASSRPWTPRLPRNVCRAPGWGCTACAAFTFTSWGSESSGRIAAHTRGRGPRRIPCWQTSSRDTFRRSPTCPQADQREVDADRSSLAGRRRTPSVPSMAWRTCLRLFSCCYLSSSRTGGADERRRSS